MKKKIVKIICCLGLLVNLSVSISAIYTPSTSMSCVLNKLEEALSTYNGEVNVKACQLAQSEIKNNFWEGASGYKFRELVESIQYSYANSLVENITIKYRYSKQSINDLLKNYEIEVGNIIASIPKNMSELDTLFYLYNHLARTTSYNLEAASNLQNFTNPKYTLYFSLFGPIYYKSAVCAGYSQAYMSILKQLGYNALYFTSDAMNHGWNLIRYENNYYHVDITYGDPIPDMLGFVDYNYFMMNDSEISKDHTWEDHSLSVNSTLLSKTNYIFNQAIKDAYYYDGYWYYILNGAIYKSKIDGSDLALVYNEQSVLDITLKNNVLYFTTSTNNYYVDKIYQFNLIYNNPTLINSAQSSTYISGLYYNDDGLLLQSKSGTHALKITQDISLYSYLQSLTLTNDDYLYGELDIVYKYYSSLNELEDNVQLILKSNHNTIEYDLARLSSSTYTFLLPISALKNGDYEMLIRYNGENFPLTSSLLTDTVFVDSDTLSLNLKNNILSYRDKNSEFDYSLYGNGLLPIYDNSRITYAKFYNNYLSLNGYALEAGANYNRANSYVRELVMIELNTNLEYRVALNASYNAYLNANKTLNPNNELDFSYAFYKSMIDFNQVYTYWDKKPIALPSGDYRIFIRLSDGVRSNVIPLRDLKNDTPLCEEFYLLENSNDVAFKYVPQY